MSKVPQRGEIWKHKKEKDVMLYVVHSSYEGMLVDVIVCNDQDLYTMTSSANYIKNNYYFYKDSKHDVEDLFKTENEL